VCHANKERVLKFIAIVIYKKDDFSKTKKSQKVNAKKASC